MKNILMISTKPSFNTFNDLAFAFSVIEGRDIKYTNWLISHFISVFYRKKWNAICFKMPYCYKWSCFRSKIIIYNSNRYNSFIKAMEKQINNGRYIYLCVNERYIPQRSDFNEKDYLHNIYIYGYDNEKKVFMTEAYNASKHFTQQEIPYENVFFAQKNKRIKNVFISFYLKSNYNFEKPDIKKIKLQLLKYFFPISRNSGVNIFRYFTKHYNQDEIKMGYAKLLVEHINVLSKLELIEYYNFNSNELIKLSENLYYISLKYTITNKKELLDEALCLLEKIKKYEVKAFKSYFDNEFHQIVSKLYMKKYSEYFDSYKKGEKYD